MKLYTDSSEYIKEKNTVVTVGSFDGLHKGHFKILNRLQDISKASNSKSVLLTFDPHPRQVVSKNYNFSILTSLDEKKEILANAGLDAVIVQKFTEEFSNLTSDQFIKNILVEHLGISHIVVGHDHKFGKDRLGDSDKLKQFGKQYNFEVTSVPAETIDGEIISSTNIRHALNDGEIEKASFLLGRNYRFSGEVVHGAQRGRTLGFPTANLKLDDPRKAIPKNGVYAVSCTCSGKNQFGVMNIGFRPTFENEREVVIEVHLIDFNKDIYGEKLSVDLIKRLRDEKKFASKDELVHQIEKDKADARKILSV